MPKKPTSRVAPKPTSPGNRGDLDAAVAFLNKKVGKEVFEPRPDLEGVSTGCVAVDYIVGNGGFPRGRVSEVFGMESSGKSTLCMTACAKAQAMGLFPVYVDVERSLIREHAAKIGFDITQKGVMTQPDTFEQTLWIIEVMAKKGGADLILVDSIPALVPESVLEGDITDMGQYGQTARLFSGSLPRITKMIERTKTALVFVNQLRANITPNAYAARFEAKEKSYGGFAMRYFSSMRLELKQLKKDYKTREVPHLTEDGMQKVPVASLHRAMCFKSKVSQPYQAAEFPIRFDPVLDLWGIDNLYTRIKIAQQRDVIAEKGGGHFTFTTRDGNLQSVQGFDAMYDWFQGRPDEILYLKERIGNL